MNLLRFHVNFTIINKNTSFFHTHKRARKLEMFGTCLHVGKDERSRDTGTGASLKARNLTTVDVLPVP